MMKNNIVVKKVTHMHGFDHALAFVSITHWVKVMRGEKDFFGLKYTISWGWGRGFKNIWLVLGGGGVI